MNDTPIPWDFLGLLLGLLIVMLIFIVCLYALKVRSRMRLISARKDYVYRSQPTRKLRDQPCRKETANYE